MARSGARRSILLLLGTAPFWAAAPAAARTEVQPYLEVGQVLTADLNEGDVLTYTTVTAGIDASVQRQRTELQLSYRYDQGLGWGKELRNSSQHTGIGRARTELVPGLLTLEGGILATRARQNFNGPGLSELGIDGSNSGQLFSTYISPSIRHEFGVLEVGANYRLSYSRAADRPAVDLGTSLPMVTPFHSSLAHSATASIGMHPGALPFGWSVNAGVAQDRQQPLSSRFTQRQIRADIELPLTASVAITGGIGQQWVKASQREALLGSDGNPLLSAKGQFIEDKTAPRRLVYDFDGLYWDAGVMWRPSSRTALEARMGKRFGTTSYSGSFSWQVRPDAALGISVFDEEETLGLELARGLDGMPSSFWTTGYGTLLSGIGCGFGSAGAGRCLNGTLSSLNGTAYRSRGANLVWSQNRGRMSYGLGLGYNRRDFLGFAGLLPDQQTWFGNASLRYQASRLTSLGTDLVVSVFDPGMEGYGKTTSETMTVSVSHHFTRRLIGNALVGVTASQNSVVDSAYGTARASLRYNF